MIEVFSKKPTIATLAALTLAARGPNSGREPLAVVFQDITTAVEADTLVFVLEEGLPVAFATYGKFNNVSLAILQQGLLTLRAVDLKSGTHGVITRLCSPFSNSATQELLTYFKTQGITRRLVQHQLEDL